MFRRLRSAEPYSDGSSNGSDVQLGKIIQYCRRAGAIRGASKSSPEFDYVFFSSSNPFSR
jgi:hypothetical protein